MEIIKNENPKGRSYVNKLAAAERQLGASIRMYFLEVDALAIHTVVCAAHNLFADLLRARGKEPSIHLAEYGLSRAARDLNDGLIGSSELCSWGEPLAALVKERAAYLIANPEVDIEATGSSAANSFQKVFWQSKRRAYNFLKHADMDEKALLDEGSINNEDIIIEAISYSLHLNAKYTPEKHFYFCTMLALGKLEKDIKRAWDLELMLSSCTPEQAMALGRRNLCRLSFPEDEVLLDGTLPDLSEIMQRADGREILLYSLE